MLHLCGCKIERDDVERLVTALRTNGSPASLEAAAAIHWGAKGDLEVDELEPDLNAAILRVLDNSTPGLVDLRTALVAAAGPKRRRRRILDVLHNPMGRPCGCLSDCWCQRTAWGRAVRWYVPRKHHTSVSECWDGEKSPANR